MDVQKINVKLFIDSPARPPAAPFLDVFSRWREEKDAHGWIDLADYGHMTRGANVMLIGKQGHLSLDTAEPGAGLLWANRAGLEGSPAERVREAFRRALTLIARLTAEPEYPPDMGVRPGAWEIAFNDRLAAPNTEETHQLWRAAVQDVIQRLLGADVQLVRQADPERRYGFVAAAAAAPTLAELSQRLNGAV